MCASNAKILSTLFRSAAKTRTNTSQKSRPFPLTSSISKEITSQFDTGIAISCPDSEIASDSDKSPKQLCNQISSVLCGDDLLKKPDPRLIDDAKVLEGVLDLALFETSGKALNHKKLVSRERKQKWILKSRDRFQRLVIMCADKLGTKATIEVLSKLGRTAGVKEYKALIGKCIDKARNTDDEDVAIEQIGVAFHLFKSMRERGFQLEEETYRPILMYLIDMGMVKEFQFFYDKIKEEDPNSISRLGYYEMKLWVAVNNEEMIQHLCNCIAVNIGKDNSYLRESYLLALCESDREKELLQLLEIIDISKLSSAESVANIFESLGRLLLESVAEKFLLALKTCDHEADEITNFIASYAVSIPNLTVEDVLAKFKDLHQKLKISPSSSSYERLILHSCDLLEMHAAVDIVDEMCAAGFTLSTEVLHSIFQISEKTHEYNLVHRIYAMICHYNLKSNADTFRFMIDMCVRMNDFEGAYKMLDTLEDMGLTCTSGMYNTIMAGYFRQKNIGGALRVLKHMQRANINPDSHTFGYLIGNCKTEEDIVKYYEELKESGTQATKQIFMALINAYAACGQFEKAEQVVLDPTVPDKDLNEIKNVLVSAFALNGQLSKAYQIYDKIKQTGHTLQPKAAISLIEHTVSAGELDRLLQLLKELSDSDFWADGCSRVILYCVRNKHLSAAVDLFKQLVDKFHDDEPFMETLFDEVFSLIATSESVHLQIGLDLLYAIKNGLGLLPSRKCLDFLLGACANAKDLRNARLIWKEYEAAELPYNVLTYLRMYQALLASGDHQSAKSMLNKISKDDPHVCSVIKACQRTYGNPTSVGGKKKYRRHEY